MAVVDLIGGFGTMGGYVPAPPNQCVYSNGKDWRNALSGLFTALSKPRGPLSTGDSTTKDA